MRSVQKDGPHLLLHQNIPEGCLGFDDDVSWVDEHPSVVVLCPCLCVAAVELSCVVGVASGNPYETRASMGWKIENGQMRMVIKTRSRVFYCKRLIVDADADLMSREEKMVVAMHACMLLFGVGSARAIFFTMRNLGAESTQDDVLRICSSVPLWYYWRQLLFVCLGCEKPAVSQGIAQRLIRAPMRRLGKLARWAWLHLAPDPKQMPHTAE
jgi:hypothetical protein